MEKIAVIIVAAGASRRMKKAKQLLPFGDTTLLGNAVRQAEISEAQDVFVVLGANAEEIKSHHDLSEVALLQNEDWENGIGSSIAAGLKYVIKKGAFRAVLLMLGDQPLIDSAYLNQMIDHFRKNPEKIVATKYPKSNGVPAIFPREFFPRLLLLKGDSGAKSLLNSGNFPVTALDAANKILDIDTPEDYQKILKYPESQ